MRVLIDTTFLCRAPMSGTGIYLARLLEALSARRDVEVVRAENPRRRPPAGGGLGSLRNLYEDLHWASVELPAHARRLGAEVIHHPLPVFPSRASLPQVLTVHDLAFELRPQDYDPRFRRYAHRAHRAAARSAAAVVAVSEATAGELRDLWGIPAERVVVARHGPGQLPRRQPGVGAGAGHPRSRYFLYVGGAEPRKDLPTLLEAYARYRAAAGPRALELVLAGSAASAGKIGSVELASAPGVVREEQPEGARLAALYAGAVALVHPSRHEGFGMTVLEAMSAGCPVVAARCAGVQELCGTAALLVWPGDPGALAAAMQRIASEAPLRAQLSARGRERAASYSWARSAESHVAAYSLALSR